MAVLGLAGEGQIQKSLTRREHRAPGGGLPYFFSQARTLGQPGERNCHMGQARWYDVYGLAVSENVPPSEDVSDRSCTTQFMFDPAAACMGHSGTLDICKRGCNCFPPEVGTAPRGRQGSTFVRADLRRPRDRLPCPLELIRPGEGDCRLNVSLPMGPWQGTLRRLYSDC